MNGGNSLNDFSSTRMHACNGADSMGTRSSASTRSGRNDENLQPTKSRRSLQCIRDFPNRPSWIPEDAWTYDADSSHSSQRSDQSHNEFDGTNNPAWNRYDPFGTRDLSPCSYDSHSSRNFNKKYTKNSSYDEPIKFDRWVNEEPISEITNREQRFYSTQLIRQTTRDADRKVIWIYSYKNRNLFPDESNSDRTASTNRSEKDETAYANSSFVETRDVRRQLNDRDMYYIQTPVRVPNHKLFEKSLETVEEAESEKTRESPGQVNNLHLPAEASGESLRSVKWTDESADNDSESLPGDTSDRKSAVYLEVHRKNERIYVRKSGESSNLSEDKKAMNLADWATKHCCIVFDHRDGATERRRNKVQDKSVNTDYTGQAISVPAARWNFRPYSWEIYYPTSPQPDSELVNNSFADTEKRGMWQWLSRCFCKCF